MGLDSHMWDEQFESFAGEYQVIRYDLRGFGKSALPDGTNYAHHTDLFALMQYFGLQQANLMGLSMGGRVIIDLALTYPEAVLSLVLVDAVLHGYQFKENFSTQAVTKAAQEGGAEAANKAWLEHDLFIPANRQPRVATQLKNIVDNYSGWHWVNKNPWIPIDPPAVNQVSKITAPSLIIIGEEDLPDFHGISNLLHEKIAGSEKVEIKGVGHMSNMEDPATFYALVSRFLSAHNA